MRKFFYIIGLASTLLAPLASHAQPTCGPSMIKIEKLKVINEGTVTTSIIGVLKNGCSTAVGPQIKFVFYDRSGEILRVEDMWPASINNIPPQSDFPFQIRIEQVNGFKKIDARVIEVRRW